MYINSRGHGRISVASHHPLGAMVHISETEGERGEFRDRCRGGAEAQETRRDRREERQSGDKNGEEVEIKQRRVNNEEKLERGGKGA